MRSSADAAATQREKGEYRCYYSVRNAGLSDTSASCAAFALLQLLLLGSDHRSGMMTLISMHRQMSPPAQTESGVVANVSVLNRLTKS